MSSALEVEFVLRSLIPLSEPKVTLILEITENSFQKRFVTLTLIAKPHCSQQPQTLDCCQSLWLRVSPHSSDYVIIMTLLSSSVRTPGRVMMLHASYSSLSQQSSVKQFTRLFIVYNTQTINGLYMHMHNELKRSTEIRKINILKSCTIIFSP